VAVDELTQIVHETRVEFYARRLVQKIKEEMPRKQFRIAVQAKIGTRVNFLGKNFMFELNFV